MKWLAYKRYEDWCKLNKVKIAPEKSILAYFSEKAKSQIASTVWNQYSMLRSTIGIKQNVDISKLVF